MASILLEFTILFSGFLYIIAATVYLAEKNKTIANYILVAFLFSIGIWQLYHGCMVSGILLSFPHLALVHVPFLYFTAPLLYFYFKILTRGNFQFTTRSLVHFVPAVLFVLILLPFYFKTAEEKRELLMSPLGLQSATHVYWPYPFIILLIVSAIGAYAVAFVIKSSPIFSRKTLVVRHLTFFSLVLIALNFMMIFYYLAGFTLVKIFSFSHSFYLFIIKSISLTQAVQIYLIMFIKARNPDYFSQIHEEAQRIRYVNSRITGLDVEQILRKLNSLMENEKVYCDEDLTLGRLAAELAITTYQLSQILNERLNMNYNTFINKYRIREAEKYLVEEPDRSITSISYAVGFNTPASFYNAFCKIHDISPVKYRNSFKKARPDLQGSLI